MKWERKTLCDISLCIQTGPFGSQLHQSDYSESGIPVVMPKDIINGKIVEESIARVSMSHVQRLKKYAIKQGDILVSRRGDVGRCAFVTSKEHGWLCGTGCLCITLNTKVVNPRFIFYQLKKEDTIRWIENHAVGSTMLNLNTTILSNIPFFLPTLNVQNTIADILSAYDNLIENNQKQIKLLEEAAQRLYKEWFVDLRFPGYEKVPIVDGVPEGWRKERADEFFNITIGKTPPRSEKQWFSNGNNGMMWASISDMGNSGTFIFNTSETLIEEAVKKHNLKVIKEGTVLLSFKLTVGRVSIAALPMCTNEAIAHFEIQEDYLREYTFCYLSQFHYDTLGSTSSISKAVNSKIVKAMPFVLPNKDILLHFSKIVSPIFKEIYNKKKSIIKLTEARDRLLPKLMSGELEV